MDAIRDRTLVGDDLDLEAVDRPSREEAMAAVRTLIAWAGDDPRREGVIDTYAPWLYRVENREAGMLIP